jgi:Na+/H+ antiporter NhaD/arsenite permease-like protein
MFQRVKKKLKAEIVFVVSLFLAIITSFISLPKLEYIDTAVLGALFSLMAVIAGFEKLKILDLIAVNILKRFRKARWVSLALIFITFVASMFITNDVALITFVPIAIIIGKKAGFDPLRIIILQTLAANIGSSLTPMGNPQNLFIYNFFQINVLDFFKATGMFVFIGLLWLIVLNQRVPEDELKFHFDYQVLEDKKALAVYIVLFVIIILSIFRVLDYKITFAVTLIVVSIMDKEILKSIDYFLLATFICFFIAIGNLSSSELINKYMDVLLDGKYRVYFTSIGMSQFISNVPAAILLSGFTDKWQSLLLGVNIGGMGTLIASLASVISYKFYIKSFNGEGYLAKFHKYNFISLTLFILIMPFLL